MIVLLKFTLVYVNLQGPLLDFFGVPVKANDLLNRVEELQVLAKRISRFQDPLKQFRVLHYLKPSNWSKGCGWNQRKSCLSLVCCIGDMMLHYADM